MTRMIGSHSQLRNWQLQVPKNRKVFRRIFGSSGEHANKRHIGSALCLKLDQGAGKDGYMALPKSGISNKHLLQSFPAVARSPPSSCTQSAACTAPVGR